MELPINLNYRSLNCGRMPEYTERTHTDTTGKRSNTEMLCTPVTLILRLKLDQ